MAQLLVKIGTTSFEKLTGPDATGMGTIVLLVQAARNNIPRITNAIFLSLLFCMIWRFNFEK
jgi:hypothetical protein